MTMSTGTEVCIFAGSIAGFLLVTGCFYKKVLAPIIAQRWPDTQPLNGHGHGGHGGHGNSSSKTKSAAHSDYEKHTEMGAVRA